MGTDSAPSTPKSSSSLAVFFSQLHVEASPLTTTSLCSLPQEQIAIVDDNASSASNPVSPSVRRPVRRRSSSSLSSPFVKTAMAMKRTKWPGHHVQGEDEDDDDENEHAMEVEDTTSLPTEPLHLINSSEPPTAVQPVSPSTTMSVCSDLTKDCSMDGTPLSEAICIDATRNTWLETSESTSSAPLASFFSSLRLSLANAAENSNETLDTATTSQHSSETILELVNDNALIRTRTPPSSTEVKSSHKARAA